MDNLDNLENTAPAQPGLTELRGQFNALRHLVVSVMVLLAVVSGTFNLYLWKRWRDASRELEAMRLQAPRFAQEVARLQKTELPAMQDFVKKITDYGRTHPDFAPVLAKYNMKATPSTSAPSTSTLSTIAAPQPAPPTKTSSPKK
jgi:hypothetical protein